jgi:hypothetical protein
MQRRDFIALLGGVFSWPFLAHAQQKAMRVIGLLGAHPSGGNGSKCPIPAVRNTRRERLSRVMRSFDDLVGAGEDCPNSTIRMARMLRRTYPGCRQ